MQVVQNIHPTYQVSQLKTRFWGGVGALVITLVAVAGILTSIQLSRTSQDTRSQASTGITTLSLESTVTQLNPGSSASVSVKIAPGGNVITAVALPITFDSNVFTVSNLAVVPTILPTILKVAAIDPATGRATVTAGTSKMEGDVNVGSAISANSTIASFTVTAKNQVGASTLSFDSATLQAAAVGSKENVAQAGTPLSLTVVAPQAVCNQTCTDNTQCSNTAGNLSCHQGNCRLTTNPSSVTCEAQTACATNIQQPAAGATVNRNAQLTWNSCSQAQAYQALVTGQDVNWQSGALSTASTTLPSTVALVEGRTYTWKARGCLDATCTTAGDWSPDSTFVLATTTTPPTTPKIQLEFMLQGLSRAGVTLPVDITVAYTPAGATTPVRVEKTVSFNSGADGKLTTPAPIELSEISIAAGQSLTGVNVFVRTPVSLVSKIGTVTLTGDTTTSVSSTTPVIVGDFLRTGDNNANVIRMADIIVPLQKYTSLSITVNDEVRPYDLNYDGSFNNFDIAIVITNFRKLEYRGDTP